MKKIILTVVLMIFTLTFSSLSNAQAPFNTPPGNTPPFITPPFDTPPPHFPSFLTPTFNTPPADTPPFATPPAHLPSFLTISSNKPPLQMPARNPVFGAATTVVPEPLSVILFLIGGSILMVRRFAKIKKGT